MKIKVLSDLHLEFDGDDGKRFIATLDPEGVDVVVLAGDICMERSMLGAMREICKRFENSKIVWVHGNHEYYFSNKASVLGMTNRALSLHSNLSFLDSSSVTIGDQRFLGATLWFPDHPRNILFKSQLNDFGLIENFESWVYQENAKAIAYLEKNLTRDDIVVTHHLPTYESVSARFRGSEFNRFFVCDLLKLIKDRGPKVWIHGHTHDTFDYQIQVNDCSSTRVVCNPRGYVPDGLNPGFDPELLIEI
jgi:predicted phosphodiesterase